MRHTKALLPFGLVAVLFVSACGSDSDSGSDSTSATTNEVSTTETATEDTVSDETLTDDTVTEDSAADASSDSSGEADSYTIQFDGEPTVGTLDAETVGAESTTRTVTLENGDFEAVAETDVADPSTTSLDGMVAGTQQSVGGDEPVVETVSLNGWEGRQWSFTFDQAGTAGTYYAIGGVIDDKLLQVGYVDVGSDNQEDAEAFIASLQVLTEGPG